MYVRYLAAVRRACACSICRVRRRVTCHCPHRCVDEIEAVGNDLLYSVEPTWRRCNSTGSPMAKRATRSRPRARSASTT